MKVGLLLPLFSTDPARAVERARHAEQLGFDGVFGFDHLIPLGGPRDGPALEVFSVLSAVAASTSRIRLGTLVARVTLRPTGLLAKQAAALDGMSGGRFILGLGTGDEASRSEAEAFGFPLPPPAERHRLLEETALACRSLFRGEPWPGGESVGQLDGPLLPRPSPGGPPIWLGGVSDSVVRLAGRVADAWNGWGLSVPRFAEKASLLAGSAGRVPEDADRPAGPDRPVRATWAGLALVGDDREEVERLLATRQERGVDADDLWSGTAEELGDFLRRLASARASWGVLMLAGPADRVELVSERVLPAVRDA